VTHDSKKIVETQKSVSSQMNVNSKSAKPTTNISNQPLQS